MLGSPANVRRKACLAASSSRPEPGSVIATKRLPSSSTSEKKCANSDSGSIVPPDLEETTNSVRSEVHGALDRADSARRRSSRGRAAARGCRRRRRRPRTSGAGPPGRARSRPCRAGRRPRVRRRAPPRRTARSAPSRRACARRSSASRGGWRSLGCPAGPHSVASSRAIRPATSSSEARASCGRDGGLEHVGNAGRDGEVGIAHARIVVGFGTRVGSGARSGV